MKRNIRTVAVTLSSTLILCGSIVAQRIGETPAITKHMSQADIESGRVSLEDAIEHGKRLFITTFNRLDGVGRNLSRKPGPDAHSCVSCHNQPRVGGGGDFSTNGFDLGENERNTLGMYGSGPIEVLALEMTRELQATRIAAIQRAFLSSANVPAKLQAKGIDFGSIVARPDGTVDTSGVQGVSGDLVIRPFHQNGAAVSLRQFTNEGMDRHMGLQSQELFGIDTDPDGDGVVNELTVGDVTALSLYQAQLGTPGKVIPADPARRKAAEEGEVLFDKVGCTGCHIAEMKIKSRMFVEANAFNPEWKLPFAVTRQMGFDMTEYGEQPRLEPTPDGGAIVRAYTDLKRHNLCDSEDRFFCNETKSQAGIPVSTFLTRKLWDVGSSAPYGHRGDLSTITEAIEHHAGEGRQARANFMKLPEYERGAVVEFLKTLQILPPGSARVISENDRRSLALNPP